MKKSEIKSGMRVTYRNGWNRLVILNTPEGDALIDLEVKKIGKAWDDYDDNLTEKNGFEALDIVKVYECSYDFSKPNNGKIIWERKGQPEIEEITADEAMRRLEESSGKKIKITR